MKTFEILTGMLAYAHAADLQAQTTAMAEQVQDQNVQDLLQKYDQLAPEV